MQKVFLVLARSDAPLGAELASLIEAALPDCELVCPNLVGYPEGDRSWWTAHAVVGLVSEAALVEASVPFELGGAHSFEKPVFAVLGDHIVREALAWPIPDEHIAQLTDGVSMARLLTRIADALGVTAQLGEVPRASEEATAIEPTPPALEASAQEGAPAAEVSETAAPLTQSEAHAATLSGTSAPLAADASHTPLTADASHAPLTADASHAPLTADASHAPLTADASHAPLAADDGPASRMADDTVPSLPLEPAADAAWGTGDGPHTTAPTLADVHTESQLSAWATPEHGGPSGPVAPGTDAQAPDALPPRDIADAISEALSSSPDDAADGAATLAGFDAPVSDATAPIQPAPTQIPTHASAAPVEAVEATVPDEAPAETPAEAQAIEEIVAPASAATPEAAVVAQANPGLSGTPAALADGLPTRSGPLDQTQPGWPSSPAMREAADATALPDAADSEAPRAIPSRSDIAPAPSVLTAAPGCEASMEAGRAFADCIFHREEGASFSDQLDVPFGNFVTALGGNWGTLRALDDIDMWMEMADNVLAALPNERYYVRLWYEVGFQLATLLNLAHLDESGAGNSEIEDTWSEAMSALTDAASQLGMGAGEVAVLEGMLENLRGPSDERDYLNFGRIESAIRQHANHADAALSA